MSDPKAQSKNPKTTEDVEKVPQRCYLEALSGFLQPASSVKNGCCQAAKNSTTAFPQQEPVVTPQYPQRLLSPPIRCVCPQPGIRFLTVTVHVPHHRLATVLCVDQFRTWCCVPCTRLGLLSLAGSWIRALGTSWSGSCSRCYTHRGGSASGRQTMSVWRLNLMFTILEVSLIPWLKTNHSFQILGRLSWMCLEHISQQRGEQSCTSTGVQLYQWTFTDSSSWQRSFYCRRKIRMWAEYFSDAADKHLALNITCSQGTSPGLCTVLCQGAAFLIDFCFIKK